MATSIWFYVVFNAFVLTMLALDLGVFHRKAHVIRPKEAALWTAAWVSLALLFCAGLAYFVDTQTAILFLTGYLVEQSLSVDNIFVIVLIFSYFAIPAQYQHRVLFWGIIGALLMRGTFIGVGALLIAKFHWVIYVFGGILIVTGIRMAMRQDEEFDADQNVVMRLARRVLPFTERYDGQKFFTLENGKRVATPLFLVLVLVEFTDLIFAVDSIPAIFGITTDPFLVYTSNVFAILGLRSLYFLLSGVVEKFHLLKYGLAVILTFVGVKMVIVDFYKIPTVASLLVILTVLTASVGLSLLFPQAATLEPHEVKGRTGSLFGSLPSGRSAKRTGAP
ncbi:MAG: TerC family protein [Gemmatimonadota bacterium]|nr:TerC family protein [Gemmatimonadota bacterium]